MANFSEMWQIWAGESAKEPVSKGYPNKKAPYPKTRNVRILNAGTLIEAGFLVRKDSGMKYVLDLKGKRIAWPWTAFPINIGFPLAGLLNGGLTRNREER